MRISQPLIIATVLAGGLGLAACNGGGNGDNNNAANNGQPASQQMQDNTQQAANNANSAGNQAATATSDTAITTAVKSKLLANSSTSGMDIHVETNHGVVTLSGTVGSDAEKDLAERIARNTDGVNDVTNDLEVSNNGNGG